MALHPSRSPWVPTSSWVLKTRWCTSLNEWPRSPQLWPHDSARWTPACSGWGIVRSHLAQTGNSLLACWWNGHSAWKRQRIKQRTFKSRSITNIWTNRAKRIFGWREPTWGCGSDHSRSHMGPGGRKKEGVEVSFHWKKHIFTTVECGAQLYLSQVVACSCQSF